MAEHLTLTEARNYDVAGVKFDLVKLVQAFNLGTEPGRKPESIGEVKVGQVVLAWLMGSRYRRGVVTKVGRSRVYVAYTTQGTIDSARQAEASEGWPAGSATIRVGNQAVALDQIKVLDAPAPVEPAAEVAPVEALTPNSQDCKVDNMNNDVKSAPAFRNDNRAPAQGEQVMTLMTPATTESHTGSTVVALLEKVWGRIRQDHPELPEVVITTGSGEGVKWGHFRPESWKVRAAEGAAVAATEPGRRHELFLASEALAKGSHQVLQTMLHEAAHTLARVRGVKDTSRQGRWHNAEFRKTAGELGLDHPGNTADKGVGFAFVKLTAATKERYADLLTELDREIRLTGLLPSWLGGSGDEDAQGGEKITGKPKAGEDKPKNGGLIKATCNCDEPLIIRLSQKVLDKRVVVCEDCDSRFTAAE